MKKLAIESDGQLDEEEVVEVQERAHTRGEPTYTQPTLNQGGSFESHPNWYKDLQGNSYPSKKSSSSSQFNQLTESSQGDVTQFNQNDSMQTDSTQFTPKEIYQRRPYNRITPAELKKWFGSTVNVKKEKPTVINKNLVVKYKR